MDHYCHQSRHAISDRIPEPNYYGFLRGISIMQFRLKVKASSGSYIAGDCCASIFCFLRDLVQLSPRSSAVWFQRGVETTRYASVGKISWHLDDGGVVNRSTRVVQDGQRHGRAGGGCKVSRCFESQAEDRYFYLRAEKCYEPLVWLGRHLKNKRCTVTVTVFGKCKGL